jgi:hypothetical protein
MTGFPFARRLNVATNEAMGKKIHAPQPIENAAFIVIDDKGNDFFKELNLG